MFGGELISPPASDKCWANGLTEKGDVRPFAEDYMQIVCVLPSKLGASKAPGGTPPLGLETSSLNHSFMSTRSRDACHGEKKDGKGAPMARYHRFGRPKSNEGSSALWSRCPVMRPRWGWARPGSLFFFWFFFALPHFDFIPLDAMGKHGLIHPGPKWLFVTAKTNAKCNGWR